MTEAYRMGADAAQLWLGGAESPPPAPPFPMDSGEAREWQQGFDSLFEKQEG